MNLKNVPSWKLFCSTFFIAFFVFGSMFGVSLYFILNSSEETQNDAQNVPVEDYCSPSNDDNLTLVLMACRQTNEVPSCYLVCKFDAVENRCKIVSVPVDTLSTVNVSEKTISEHYQYGGPKEAADACANLFLLDADAYLRLDTDGIRMLTDYFSGFEWTFQQDVETSQYQYSKGAQLIDGNRMGYLLMDAAFAEKAELLAEFFETHLSEKLTAKLDEFYSLLFEYSDTDLSRSTLNRLDKPIHRFLRLEKEKTTTYLLSGNIAGEVFVPQPDSLKQLQQQFSDQEITKS